MMFAADRAHSEPQSRSQERLLRSMGRRCCEVRRTTAEGREPPSEPGTKRMISTISVESFELPVDRPEVHPTAPASTSTSATLKITYLATWHWHGSLLARKEL